MTKINHNASEYYFRSALKNITEISKLITLQNKNKTPKIPIIYATKGFWASA